MLRLMTAAPHGRAPGAVLIHRPAKASSDGGRHPAHVTERALEGDRVERLPDDPRDGVAAVRTAKPGEFMGRRSSDERRQFTGRRLWAAVAEAG